MNKNIEVEGGEIAIRNSHGDLAIIPKNKVNWVKEKLSEGCHDCIDGLVETLPVASQYAGDGSVYPPGKKVKVNQNNQIKEYDISSPEYKELYNSGKLTTYDKNSDTYIATPLQEVIVTAEAPQWLKYKREYEKTNPKSNYIKQYLTPFAKSLGNTETNYPKRLDDEYEQKSLDYASEQLVKNKPQGKLSRAEWLNTMSDKEEELIKRNPKYQSSLWSDTKRGLISLVEQNPAQTFQNILNSSDYSNREKREMLKDYADHPIMSKLGDAAKILNPLTVPSKMVQSAYKDDYSFTDALKGKKNNAGIVEDIVTDPLNFVGVGLVGKLSKVDKVIDATKAGSKVLSKTDDVVKNLPKLEQIPLDFKIEDVLKNISSTERKNMEIVKKGNAYFKELDNPESLKRLKEFGDEYGIDLLNAYKKAEKRWDYGNNIGKNDRFQVAGKEVFKDDIESALGLSTVTDDYFKMKMLKPKTKTLIPENKAEIDKHSINYVNKKASIEDYNTIVWHELSHDINKNIIGQSTKLQKDLSDIFVKSIDEVDKTKIEAAYKSQKFDTYEKGLVKSKKENMSVEDIAKDELAYVSKPTETWAFLSTNLRQDLKNTGVIKNYNELLTPEKLEQAIKNGNTVFSRFEPYIKDKEAFIKLFNKMTLSITPAVLYLQSQQNKDENKLGQ